MTRLLAFIILCLTLIVHGQGLGPVQQPFFLSASTATPETPLTVPGIVFWGRGSNCLFDAVTKVVTNWTDYSGNGFDASGPSSGILYSNSDNSISWVNSSGWLSNAAAGDLDQPNTLFVVAKFHPATSCTGVERIFGDCYGTGADISTWNIVKDPCDVNNRMRLYASAVGNTPNNVTQVLTNNWVLYTCQWNGASSFIRTNAVTLTGSINPGANSMAGFQFSDRTIPGLAYQFYGQIREAILYSSSYGGSMTSNQMYSVESYLATKWGITIP